MTDNRDVVERLTRKHRVQPPFGGGSLTHDGKFTGYITDDGMRLVNPDGPEAAAEIKRLRAQVEAARIEGARAMREAAAMACDDYGNAAAIRSLDPADVTQEQ